MVLPIPLDSDFPEATASRLSELESFNKHLYRPNSYLHKWWARRSGTITRFMLKQLEPKSGGYYSPGGMKGVRILDPMMGGGTTVHEAIRLEANVVGVDIDPIPVLQTKASLENRPLSLKEEAFDLFLAGARRELVELFLTTCPICKKESELRFMLYGSRRKCDCGETIVVDSLVLRHSSEGKTVRICGECHEVYADGIHTAHTPSKIKIVSRDVDRCPKCFRHYQLIEDLPYEQRYSPIAVVGICRKDGQFFKQPDQSDLILIDKARKRAMLLRLSGDFTIRPGPKTDDLIHHKVRSYIELYSPRQLLYLDWCIRTLRVMKDDSLWLGLLISTSLEFNSMLCGYKGADIRRPGAIRHVFAHHAYSIPYTALENNPIQKNQSSGSLTQLFNGRVSRASRWAENPTEAGGDSGASRVEILGESDRAVLVTDWKSLESGAKRLLLLQADASQVSFPKAFFDFVVTDPPYYDNVQYSDLSAFFRVWLNQLLPREADWSYDHNLSAVHTGRGDLGERYRKLMTGIWKKCAYALRTDGRLVFTFHHWKPQAWAELGFSLREAGFQLVNRYVVHSENPTSVHIKNLKSLKHDAILVLRVGKGSSKRWERPTYIDSSDSYQFVRGCGTLLGWMLESTESESTLRHAWEIAMKSAAKQ